MKITNTQTGMAYQLTPDTQLEVERSNLFFNEWGEQTLPVDIPDSEWNQKALGYPDIADMRKLPSDIQATISSGEYFSACRQAVLSVKRKSAISTSFYLNDGSFLSRISRASLREVFADETIPGVETVQQGIDFCRSLMKNEHERFSIFPVFIDFDNERRYINRVEFLDDEGNIMGTTTGKPDLYHAFPRTEEVDGIKVKLDAGYYISPFIRAPYLLRRVFSYFGYNLLENFFDVTEPFRSMVFVNNTMDSLVNGTILLSHLVPDCKCSTILNVFRKKFLCEFIADEVKKTVTVEFFRDVSRMKAETDLSGSLASGLEFSTPEYQKVSLSSETVVSSGGDTYDSTSDLKDKYPNACLYPLTGEYYRIGFTEYSVVKQLICSAGIPYMDGDGSLKEKKFTCPDSMFSLVLETSDSRAIRDKRARVYVPYIGDGRSLNSTLIICSSSSGEEEGGDTVSESSSNKEQSPMLSLIYRGIDGYNIGTNTNYKNDKEKFADYSLLYNGPDGIFEKFYRPLDDLLRNSMHKVKGDILLSDHQKMSIPSHRKVVIDGQELFIDKLKYCIGGDNGPVESDFFTSRLYEPVRTAIPEEKRFPIMEDDTAYWKLNREQQPITEAEFNAELMKFELGEARTHDTLPAIYPPFPTREQVAAGGTYYERSYAAFWDSRTGMRHYYRIVTSLTPIKTPYD